MIWIRRPLCLAALAFVLTVLLLVYAGETPSPSYDREEGRTWQLTGVVDKIEYQSRQNFSAAGGTDGQDKVKAVKTKQMVLHLKQVQEEILTDQNTCSENLNIICYMNEQEPEPHIGQWVRVKGELQQFSRATNPGEFDSRQYYHILNISFRLKKTSILNSSENYSKYLDTLYNIKKEACEFLENIFTQNDAGTLKTMLLGDKSTLDTEVKTLYQENGIIHILSISGLHISVIGMGFYKLLRKARVAQSVSAPVSMCFVLSYGLMTGMGASSARAIFMFSLQLTGILLGRTYDMITALSLIAVLMLIQEPQLVRNSGFLLSFGAVAAIGLFLPEWKNDFMSQIYHKKKRQKPEKGLSVQSQVRYLADGMLTSSAVSVATLPILLAYNFSFPVYSVFLNLLVIPLSSAVMIASMMLLGCGAGFRLLTGLIPAGWAECLSMNRILSGRPVLSIFKAAAWPEHLMLSLIQAACNFCGKLPGSNLICGKPENWQIILYYIFLTGYVLTGKELSIWIRRQFLLMAVVLLTLHPDSGMKISFLDVGQGDCIVVQNDNGNCYMIDGGSTTKKEVGKYQIAPFLKYTGIAELSGVFLTHPDEDHMSGIRTLLEESDRNGIKIRSFVLPMVSEKIYHENLEELSRLAMQHHVEVRFVKSGDVIRDQNLELVCLNPDKDAETEEMNEISEVFALHYPSLSVLLTGDITGTAETKIIRKWELLKKDSTDFRVLKVAHHGSKYSTPSGLLDLMRPQLAVISSGKNNRYGHPHTELLERLEQEKAVVAGTQQSGAITISVTKSEIQLKKFLESNHKE